MTGFRFKVLFLVLALSAGSCLSRTRESDLSMDWSSPGLGNIYIYMPRNVDVRARSREDESVYINDIFIGTIRPGYSLGYVAEPGFVSVTTNGAYQERLERVFYLGEGESLFIAMENGRNLRETGFLFYLKGEEEGLAGIRSTRFTAVSPDADGKDAP